MKGWKRWKRGFGKRRTTTSSGTTAVQRGSSLSNASVGSSGAGTPRKSKNGSGKHRKKSVVNRKQSHPNSSSKNSRVNSRGISQSQSVIASGGSQSSRLQEAAVSAVSFKNPFFVRRSYGPEGYPMVCDATHEGRIILREEFNLPVDILFNMLFSNTSTFLRNFHEKRQSRDLNMGEWITVPNGDRERTVKVTVALQGNVGPKTSNVTEYQTIRKCSEAGKLYSIDVNSTNAGIPYADAFNVEMHFCMKCTVENHTDVVIFAQVKFIKSVWAVIKTFIEKNTYAGLEEFFQSMQKELHEEFNNTKKS
ncbi:uncharacterized protein Dwil_GK19339 [Drosophila willistoni]|uniref:VASt domain-containing protein n=1 Tax=Drosophila willistoni TaxID=7260 RepID=B4MNH4_DROWI|nr:protein Aster-B [Drosophila willistoni]EDW73663.1 uncharacterized protein Dwil_GK19339 [Drosophila willistoni]